MKFNIENLLTLCGGLWHRCYFNTGPKNLLTLCGGLVVAGVFLAPQSLWGQTPRPTSWPPQTQVVTNMTLEPYNDGLIKHHKGQELCFVAEQLHKNLKQNFQNYQGSKFQSALGKFANEMPSTKTNKLLRQISKMGGYEEQKLLQKLRQEARHIYNSYRHKKGENDPFVKFTKGMLEGEQKIWLHFAAYYEARTKLLQDMQAAQGPISSDFTDPYKLTYPKAYDICADFVAEVTGGRYETRPRAYARTLTQCGSDTYDLEKGFDHWFKDDKVIINYRMLPRAREPRFAYSKGSLLPNGKSNFAVRKSSMQRMPACYDGDSEQNARRQVVKKCRAAMRACSY